MLSLVQLVLLNVVALTVAKLMKQPMSKVFFPLVEFTSLSVASSAIMIFECDARLEDIPETLLVMPPQTKVSFFRMDYNTQCGSADHNILKKVAIAVAALWCVSGITWLLGVLTVCCVV